LTRDDARNRRRSRSRRGTSFGGIAVHYDRARLRYDPRVFSILERRCGLRPGVDVLEIGPGTGIATRELVRHRVRSITAVERDLRMVRYLRRHIVHPRTTIEWIVSPFQEATLPSKAFDLAIAATSFHWLPQRRSLRKIVRALRPGGWWASWITLHRDPRLPSAFHEMLGELYKGVGGRDPRPAVARARFERADRKRLDDLAATKGFERIRGQEVRGFAQLTTREVVDLWGSFSDILVLKASQRAWFLDELRRRVDGQFGGHVRFPIVTRVYTARRARPSAY
jgi:ubiquinone/menaquinone biosynthesis C-methylase UbiE